jgi:hypothetical protein
MDKNGEEVPLLVAQTGPLEGQRWPLRTTLIVGRDVTCDIVVLDRQVSRMHARFTLTPMGATLEDLDSKNGTHRNGAPIQDTVLLQDGDMIQIALAQQFVFLNSDATVPLESEDLDFPVAGALGLRMEKRSRRVWIGSKEVVPPLSVSQFRLLELLYDNQDRIVTRQELIAAVWDASQAMDVSEQALDALVRRLRDRLAAIDPNHAYIATVRGHGLRLDNRA